MSPFSALDPIDLRSSSGAGARVSRYGAQVLSWSVPERGEQLFLSTRARLDRSAPIRGGVPIVFPQFAGYGPLPQHGFVRNRDWRVEVERPAGDAARAVFRIEDDSGTRAVWPCAFACELTVAVDASRLVIALKVRNRDSKTFAFHAALHTYLRVDDIDAVRLAGLRGTRFRDRTIHDEETVERADELAVRGEIDRIYIDAPSPLVLREPGRETTIGAEGFPDLVVWNPWKEKAALLSDLPDDAYLHMLCVEAAAVVVPIRLAPGESWFGSQTLVCASNGMEDPDHHEGRTVNRQRDSPRY